MGTSEVEWGKAKEFGERLGKVCTCGGRWGKVWKVRERLGEGGKR